MEPVNARVGFSACSDPRSSAKTLKTHIRLLCAGLVTGLIALMLNPNPARAQPIPIQDPNSWQLLEPGLELGRISTSSDSSVSTINVLRIDTHHFKLELFNASAQDNVLLTPKQWAQANGLVAVINASMFQEDLSTSVSLMRTERHTNNSYQSKDNTILAFGPATPRVPEVKIIDRQCDDFDTWKTKYTTLIQSIRMISCKGRNVWRTQSRKSSVSAVAMDQQDRILFIHTKDAFITHNLINILLQQPLNITRAMYVEGGPQAQLYIDSGGRKYEFTGSIGALFTSGANLAWPLPNVIGVERRAPRD